MVMTIDSGYNPLMVDLVKIFISAGNGGDGRISFFSNRRTIKGGPDGGDGGDGGSVIAVATSHENTLRNFAGLANLSADNGHMGGATNMHGKNAEDLHIKLPVGTRIWRIEQSYIPNAPKRMYRNDRDLGRVERPIERRASSLIQQVDGVFKLIEDPAINYEEESVDNRRQTKLGEQTTIVYGMNTLTVRLVGDLTEEAQEVVIARGGRGGRGNETFKSSRNTTPIEAQTGEGGESAEYIFELSLLAQVGLVGFPNAGKSTLLSVLTKATPKIANYPFTTLEPNLGVMSIESDDRDERRSIVIADLPGLIEGASEGKGLGTTFLRHVSRCKVLVFVLSVDDAILLDEELPTKDLVAQYLAGYETLVKELETYEIQARNSSVPFAEKRQLVILSKADLLSPDKKESIQKSLLKKFPGIFWISGATGEGIGELKKKLL